MLSEFLGWRMPMSETAGSTRQMMTRLAERHYAHLSPGYVADTVRADFGEMGIVEKGTVRRLG